MNAELQKNSNENCSIVFDRNIEAEVKIVEGLLRYMNDYWAFAQDTTMCIDMVIEALNEELEW